MKRVSGIYLFLIVFLVSGCAGFKDFESKEWNDAVTLTLSAKTIQDSSVTVGAMNLSDGYVTLGIATMDLSKQDMNTESFFKQKVNNLTFLTHKVENGVEVNFTFSGLIQNTPYWVYGVGSNADGVLGDIQKLSVKTDDNHAPIIQTKSSLLKSGVDVVLVFDEPVVYDPLKNVELTYLNYGQIYGGNDLEVKVSNDTVRLTPKAYPKNGELIFVGWDEGAFTDSTGNPVAEMVSGLTPEGGVTGLFFVVESKVFIPTSIMPANEDSVPASSFTDIQIAFDEPFSGLSDEYDVIKATDPITVTYLDRNLEKTVKVVLPSGVKKTGEEYVQITLPLVPTEGQRVTLHVPSGAFYVGLYNPNALIEETWMVGKSY